ncbi:hypothetical protein Thiowin_02600 [Thiorhodovibrio winogradskyi]|uniref:Nif11 domain-containing protein n=1 Tax=Thiorhodovibrio winogradskyi TaxID=77007 RepID=A0ABZ0SDA8_9GAMM|nr:hypothetical protein [Thiorhodovibrio winogradskyi]
MADIEGFAVFLKDLADNEPEVYKELGGANADAVVSVAEARGFDVSHDTVHQFGQLMLEIFEHYQEYQNELSEDALDNVSGGAAPALFAGAGSAAVTALPVAGMTLGIVAGVDHFTGNHLSQQVAPKLFSAVGGFFSGW